MRKHELVFLHSLLAVVREWLAERGEVPEGAFEAYDASSVPAAAINRRKADHEEAIWLLLGGILVAIGERRDADEASPVAADA